MNFSVGLLGKITPVAVVKPIKLKGNTISNIDLGHMSILESLNLREGCEVKVSYDIIPTLSVDDTCKSGKKPIIEPPVWCPVCNEPLNTLKWKCENLSC